MRPGWLESCIYFRHDIVSDLIVLSCPMLLGLRLARVTTSSLTGSVAKPHPIDGLRRMARRPMGGLVDQTICLKSKPTPSGVCHGRSNSSKNVTRPAHFFLMLDFMSHIRP